VQELETRREDVVDLERHGAEEQDEEAVIDHGMHQPRRPVSHEGLHPQAGVEPLQPLEPAAGAPVRLSPLPVPGPEGEQMEGKPDPGGHADVKERLDDTRHVAEHHPADHELGMIRHRAHPPEEEGCRGRENAQRLEDDRGRRQRPRRGLFLHPLVGQGHGRGV
jgi:hypothetical protein